MSVEKYRILPDLPSKNPTLDFNYYSKALADIIKESDPQFAIGIFGGWGSGKTTLMQAIEAQLDGVPTIPVQFNAWRYEKEEHLIIPLLDTIREALLKQEKQHPDLKKTIKETASTIGKVTTTLMNGFSVKAGLPGALELSFDANKALSKAEDYDEKRAEAEVPRSFYYASFRALKDAFEKVANKNPKFRIVVFIDDLDRCLPDGALEVIESMKLFFDLPGFVFVVGLDRAVVEWAVDTKYKRLTSVGTELKEDFQIRGSDYVKKIFQVPFNLTPVMVTKIDDYLNSIYTEVELPPEQVKDLREYVRPHLQFVVTESGINPREIKRYINAYILLIKARPDLPERNTMLALQTISFRRDWQVVLEAIPFK